jgi:hypothetical protein
VLLHVWQILQVATLHFMNHLQKLVTLELRGQIMRFIRKFHHQPFLDTWILVNF